MTHVPKKSGAFYPSYIDRPDHALAKFKPLSALHPPIILGPLNMHDVEKWTFFYPTQLCNQNMHSVPASTLYLLDCSGAHGSITAAVPHRHGSVAWLFLGLIELSLVEVRPHSADRTKHRHTPKHQPARSFTDRLGRTIKQGPRSPLPRKTAARWLSAVIIDGRRWRLERRWARWSLEARSPQQRRLRRWPIDAGPRRAGLLAAAVPPSPLRHRIPTPNHNRDWPVPCSIGHVTIAWEQSDAN